MELGIEIDDQARRARPQVHSTNAASEYILDAIGQLVVLAVVIMGSSRSGCCRLRMRWRILRRRC